MGRVEICPPDCPASPDTVELAKCIYLEGPHEGLVEFINTKNFISLERFPWSKIERNKVVEYEAIRVNEIKSRLYPTYIMVLAT